ncbi:molybdopterin-dependent oxidoreductase [Salinispirillum sp. LH 10-3-1]|uniref:Molybdopterin-dependent oxidoreductase n=1 Tax=Salinispirillum sp. LH 10-3-1 TaxID=2952525 RepID=A0AB38YF57_9GAMM
MLKTCAYLLWLTMMVGLPATAASIVVTVDGVEDRMSVENLRAIKAETLHTGTPWTDTEDEFEGIYLASLLEYMGVSPEQGVLALTALNDYRIEAPLMELVAADAFLGFARNGELMPVRNYGPFWLLFPFTERPELNDRAHRGWAVWQLKALDIRQ